MSKIVKKKFIEPTQEPALDNGYERVRYEILSLAIKDYKHALRLKAKGRPAMVKVQNLNVLMSDVALENWFLSDWGQALSGNNGELIIELCKKEVEKELKK